jgi:hypothetical protein
MESKTAHYLLKGVSMKTNKMQFAMIVALALIGVAHAKAETITINSQFTPIENLSAPDRASLQQQVESEHPAQKFNWEQLIVGKNEDGKIEVRDKFSLHLQAVTEPTCVSGAM